MAYEATSLQRHDTYATYTIHLDGEERAAFFAADDPTAMVTDILRAGGAPPPNQVIVHRLSNATDSSIQNELDQIIDEITHGGGGNPPHPHPPVAVVYHQESGAHISRYIAIVIMK